MPGQKPIPRISEAEWEVMNRVWDDHPATAQEVCDAIGPRKGWSPRTVKTLLNRLVKKGVLGFEADGASRRYRYHPRVTREACLREESRSFLERVSGGSMSPLLAWFVSEGDLSADDIRELRRLLEEKQREIDP